jgi:hypothetical protein
MTKRSMRSHHAPIGKSTEWVTPKWILEPLGSFDLDPCTPDQMPWVTAGKMLRKEHDGLKTDWSGRVWLNPPFDRRGISQWLEKMADHGNGIALIPAATETKHFKNFVWDRATSVLFLHKRPKFHLPSGEEASANSGCSICLVGYGHDNDITLMASGLGYFVRL